MATIGLHMVKLLPVKPNPGDNPRFLAIEECREILDMCLGYYGEIGYNPPWISYFAESDGNLVGTGGFKGRPVNNKIEIAYSTFPQFRKQGIGGRICAELVRCAKEAAPDIIVTARTLPEEGYSTRILRKNGFLCAGVVWDNEDGEVWEWFFGKLPA